jgi:signal transduction histidine kinase/CheY-like chemotaxis protein/ligand-binding sensor domain-containing protein
MVKTFMPLNYRHILLCIISIALSFSAVSVKFNSVNSLFGISIRVTNSICKDDIGFIWASSKTGILRLTDDDYRIYQLPYETKGVLIVNLIYENSKLTAYTNNGQVFKYNPVYDRFDLLFNLNNLLEDKNFDVYSLLTDNNNDYWIALNTGLYKYKSGKLELIDKVVRERYSISWIDSRQLLIISSEGIRQFDTQTLKSKNIYETNISGPFSVSSVFFDRNRNKLWLGTLSNGLFIYDFNSGLFSRVLQSIIPRQPVLAIEENSDSTLLIGIDGQGIWELNKLGKEVLNVYKESADDANSLPGNGVYDIFYDRGKRVWVATISGGVSFYDLVSPIITQVVHHANNENSLVNNDVNGILEDSVGKIWFATNNGISVWNPLSNQWKSLFNNKLEQAQVFLSLCGDDKGRIWAGSYSSGVYVLDEKTGNELAHYAKGVKGSPTVSNFIFDIFKDSGNDLWIGGVNGKFICYKTKENSFRIYSEKSISSFAELSSTQILIGQSYGLSMLNKQTGRIEDLLSDIVVQDILVLGTEIWICTSGEGLVEYNFKTGETKKYTIPEGFPSNFINSIVYAGNYLWLGTEGGLCRFDPIEKTAVTFSSIIPLSAISYNKSAVTVLKNGKLAWGTNSGIISFSPDSLREISSGGRIYFQDLSVSGRSIRDTSVYSLNTPVDKLDNITLKYFQNTISLELLPINVTSGARFSWKLEGFENDWSTPTNSRIITYTNIPSGNFTLQIKLFDSSLSNVLSERAIAIRLIPPFWKRVWFVFLMIIVISGIIILLLLYYINSLKQKHTEEKVSFFTNTAHEIRTALTLIKAPVEELTHEKNLSETGKQYLQIAVNQARLLSSVVTQLMDFQKADIRKETLSLSMTDIVKLVSDRRVIYESLAKSRNIHVEFVTDRDRYVTAIDVLKMEKIIDNLISNAVKYSHNGGKVIIEFKADKSRWSLTVKDSGIGIGKNAQRKLFREFYRGENAMNSKIVGSGIGLLLVKNYITIHGGTISYESQENVGSTFQVVIPYKEVAENEQPESFSFEPELIFDVTDDLITTIESSPENIQTRKMSILIVEDNEELRNFIAGKIEGEFITFVAEDGETAWQLILTQSPDLIISDVMMPNKNGFELCQQVKSTWETSHIPIILLTALTDKAKQIHGLGLGADDYLTKPFDMNVLVQKIRTIIRNREVVREKALKLINKDITEPLLANEYNDRFVKKLMEVAWANISNTSFDKDEFASAMNVSSSLLYKKVKSLTGQSPTDLIKTIRLRHASELLQSRKYTVTEVSEMCGFSSVGYFSTVFKGYFGKSPTGIQD